MMTLGDVQGKQIEKKIRNQLLQSLNVRLHEYFEAWKHSITSTT